MCCSHPFGKELILHFRIVRRRARREKQTPNGIGWLSVEDEVAKPALDPLKLNESRREKTSVS
jgi:hypothetical protein